MLNQLYRMLQSICDILKNRYTFARRVVRQVHSSPIVVFYGLFSQLKENVTFYINICKIWFNGKTGDYKISIIERRRDEKRKKEIQKKEYSGYRNKMRRIFILVYNNIYRSVYYLQKTYTKTLTFSPETTQSSGSA